MNLTVTEKAGLRLVEGPPGEQLMRTSDDAVSLVEACFSNMSLRALLYAPNLTARFFDLSSGEAGAILQKLRQYRIRVALVCPTGSVQFTERFQEMANEEARGQHFHIFESAEPAREWLTSGA